MIRVASTTQDDHMAGLVRLVHSLQADGRQVIIVTANRPFSVLEPRLRDAGVDADAVVFVDTVTLTDGSRPIGAPKNVFFLHSPTMLEMVAMRVEQALSMHDGPAHLVLDSLNALQLYNGTAMVQEFAHYLINRLRTRGAAADFVMLATPDAHQLEAAIAGFTDGRHDLINA